MVYIHILLLALITEVLSSPLCVVDKNFCLECHSITNLCSKCEYDSLVPDLNGGCTGSKKCAVGKNYCVQCAEDNNLCAECEKGFFKDENGGCSYADNCEISYQGNCIKCKNDYYLIGNEFKICKNLNSDDFQNCKEINLSTGLCSKCKEDYFLNSGDKKCVSIEHCYESSFGICKSCEGNYILNKQKEICEERNEELLNCKSTIDGKLCDECNEGFYFSEDEKCVKTNFCQKASNECLECKNGYFLSSDKLSCTNEKNCLNGDPTNGLCNWCLDNYYLDTKDRKCKSNLEKDELKHCKLVKNEECYSCDKYYYLGKDNKCSISQNCVESKDGLCLECIDGFYLGKDSKCTNVKNCIYSTNNECTECEDGFYYDRFAKICKETVDNFLNCKINSVYLNTTCGACKKDFYLRQNDSLCFSNKEEGPFYKCEFSNYNGEVCESCVGDYYIGRSDYKCNLIEGCIKSENEKKCLECDNYYCLDNKGNCVNNYYITDEEKAFYFSCKALNEEGNGCAVCENGVNATKKGICYDDLHCETKENGICTKCQKKNQMGFFSYCLNEMFGCVNTFLKNCVRCDNILDLDLCTKCEEGYEIDENGHCVLKQE